ncbi:hypothetical protein [Burkholderia vietnamiensis]|uniref:hypothetical protein n=1 Tax=Burkholderia vietnamiensis TaxID=60552 RepID=UPI00075DEC18|nr:hypothetical protein [Burkholderia vietnamiensis]KVE68124.1 hypothetical protein WI97_08915 [Burkholderia vietnamiensis]
MYDAILRHVRATIHQLPKLYDWDFDETTVPLEIRLPDTETLVDKNLALKAMLNAAWRRGSDTERKVISDWYIKDWGRVRTNAPETLLLYATANEEEILARGATGIASWSKALTIRNPMRFTTFDARTSISLNAIQLLGGTPKPLIFQSLPSRNSRVPLAQKTVKRVQKLNEYERIKPNETYRIYNKLLADVAATLGDSITNQMVEMLLFSQADEFSEKLVAHYDFGTPRPPKR